MRKVTFVGLTLAALAAACQALIGIDDDRFVVRESEGGPAPTADAADAGPRCALKTIPARPVGAVDGNSRTYTFVVNGFTLAAGGPDGDAPAGFDLDGKCTCDRAVSIGNGSSCVLPADPLVEAGCDRDGGVDNAVASFEDLNRGALKLFLGDGGLLGTNEFECGRRAVILVLSGYNGLRDDPEVDVRVMVSYGMKDQPRQLRDAAPSGCKDAVDFQHVPLGDGDDIWSVTNNPSDNGILITNLDAGGVDEPVFATNTSNFLTGYVSNFTLVVDPADGRNVPIAVADQVVKVGRPVLVASLERFGGSDAGRPLFRIAAGSVAGRVKAADVLTAVGSYLVDGGNGGVPLCQASPPLFALAARDICRARDLALVPADDDSGTAPCESLSVGASFMASPGLIGSQYDPSNAPADCGVLSCDDF